MWSFSFDWKIVCQFKHFCLSCWPDLVFDETKNYHKNPTLLNWITYFFVYFEYNNFMEILMFDIYWIYWKFYRVSTYFGVDPQIESVFSEESIFFCESYVPFSTL
jgi:hypothetical protein